VSEEGIIEAGIGGGVCWSGWELCARGWSGKIFCLGCRNVRRGCQSLGRRASPADVALRLCLQLRQNPPACSPWAASVVWDLSLLIS